MKMIEDAAFFLTYKCNFHCPRCIRKHAPKDIFQNSEMTFPEFNHIIERIEQLDLSFHWVALTGGEPTLVSWMKDGIELMKASKRFLHIAVFTNGYDRNVVDYGLADSIHVANYGAMNRLDIFRLTTQDKKRVVVGNAVQFDYHPEKEYGNTLPADCPSACYAFVRDKVYSCGLAAQSDPPGINMHIDENWSRLLEDKEKIFGQSICRNCIANMKVKQQQITPAIFEWNIWGTRIYRMWSIPRRVLNRLKIGKKPFIPKKQYDSCPDNYRK